MSRQETEPEERPSASDNHERLPADENAPLLGDDDTEHRQSKCSPFTQPISALNIAVYISYFIALELGQTFPANAFHQAVEENLCRELHGRTDAKYCGAADDVQSELAVLMGWYSTAQLIPGLLCAIPYALLADRYGQKPFFVLNAFGMAVAVAFSRIICFWPDLFSVHLVWTAPLLLFVGGGFTVSNALLFANVTGLTTDASRASIISVITALSYGPRLIATVVSSKLLELHGPWPLLWGSLACSFLGVVFALFIVEPKSTKIALDDCGASGSDGGLRDEEQPAAPAIGRLKAKLFNVVTETRQGFSYLLQRCNAHVVRIALCLVIMTLAWQANLGSEIMRRKFGWTWAQLSYLSAMQIIVTLVSSMILLPGASYIMTVKLKLGTAARDLTIARVCGLLFLLGGGLMVLSPTGVTFFIGVGVWNLGTVYNLVFRNLLVLAVGENSVMLFSCINTVEGIGNLAMAPFIAQVFKFGLHLGGVWVALPVMVGLCFATVGLLLLGFKND